MANIKAFHGLRYNTQKCGQFEDLVAPPYDIISGDAQTALYEKNDYNAVRLEYGYATACDTEFDNRYTRTREYLSDWMQLSLLAEDAQECIYLYEQEFDLHRHHYVHRGFITLVELEEFSKGIILPHEETTADARTDRYRLISTAEANFSPIYCLYTDAEKKIHALMKKVRKTAPDADFVSDNGMHQRLWAVSDKSIIAAAVEAFKDKQLFIADGIHRYEAALMYKNKVHTENPEATAEAPYNYAMMMLSDMDDPGVIVFPTHRVLKSISMDEAMTISFLKDDFFIEKIIVDKRASELAEAITYDLASTNDSKIYALYFGDNYYYRARPKDTSEMDTLLPDCSEAFRHLDVTVLHKLLLEKHFKIGAAETEDPQKLTYTRGTQEALEAVQSGAQQCCIILKPTKVHEIKDVALAGEKMPPKSTYFYPKQLSGLVMYKF